MALEFKNAGEAYVYLMHNQSTDISVEDRSYIEGLLINDPYLACLYAIYFLKRPWPEAEAVISKGTDIVKYIKECIRMPHPPFEPIIVRSARKSYEYARTVINGVWQPGEMAISKASACSYFYARNVIDGPFPLGENSIAQSPGYSLKYAAFVLKSRWALGEASIATNLDVAIKYAQYVVKGEFHFDINGTDVHELLLNSKKYGLKYKILCSIIEPLIEIGVEPDLFRVQAVRRIYFDENKIDKMLLAKIPPIIRSTLRLKDCRYMPGNYDEKDYVWLTWD